MKTSELRASPFLVGLNGVNEDNELRVFNAVNKRAYSFNVGWDDLVATASEDEELELKLVQEFILTRDVTYLDAVESLLQVREEIANKTLNITFTVTTKCPLRCPYCFQSHLQREHSETKTIDSFQRLLRKTLMEEQKLRSAFLLIMGGEPLICHAKTEKLLTDFVICCEEAEIPFTTVMTINGNMVKQEVLDRLGQIGLQSLQVTFDGNRTIHETVRPKSYDAIMNNLPYLTSRFSTAIKYNVSKASSEMSVFEEFLDDLEKADLDPSSYLLEFEPLKQSPATKKEADCYHSLMHAELSTTLIRMIKSCHNRSLPASLGPALRSPCVGTTNNSLLIETNGNVRSCITAYGSDSFGLGHIDELDSLLVSKKTEQEIIKKNAATFCAEKACPFLPICQTGCLFDREQLKLNSLEEQCRFDYFSGFFPELADIIVEKRSKNKVLNLYY